MKLVFKHWDLRNVLGSISYFIIGIMLAGYKKRIIASRNKNMVIFFRNILVMYTAL
jgi:hypothetical protein